MMANLALALAWDCGPLAAAEAWEEVLAAGASNVWVQAAAGLAFTSAIKGRSDDARRYLENLNGQELSGEDKFSATFARAALAAADAGPARHQMPEVNREQQQRMDETLRRAHEILREPTLTPRRPVNRPDVSPSREFSPETPRKSKQPDLELKY